MIVQIPVNGAIKRIMILIVIIAIIIIIKRTIIQKTSWILYFDGKHFKTN